MSAHAFLAAYHSALDIRSRRDPIAPARQPAVGEGSVVPMSGWSWPGQPSDALAARSSSRAARV
jgi:hypothetical protein